MKLLKIIPALLLTVSALDTKAQKYDDIFFELPNNTLDQSFGYLHNFQIDNPYFANTYVQMAIISEQKMVLTDPLLEIEKSQYWADNALKYFDEFKKFFKENDLNNNYEYYENLQIKQAGKRIQASDIEKFIKEHKTFCKNFKDSTFLAYSAIEKSKSLYNKCLESFTTISKEYPTVSKIVTNYNKDLKEKINELRTNYNNAVSAFGEYRKIIKAYPIASHRQVIDYKDIANYGIDGLTNSNFYENRFTIWNYGKWADEVDKQINDEIAPLKKRIEEINGKYTADYEKYKSSATIADNKGAYYTDNDLRMIRKYDQNALIISLFDYLEKRNRVLQLASDKLTSAMDTTSGLTALKMRHLYKTANAICNAQRALQTASENIGKAKSSVFGDFISKKYNGTEGFKSFASEEKAFLNFTMNEISANFGSYQFIVDKLHKKQTYSKKTKFANIPLWIIDKSNPTGETFCTTNILYNTQGKAIFAAVTKQTAKNTWCFVAHINDKNETAWLSDIKGATRVRYLLETSDKCLVVTDKGTTPTCTVFSNTGKEELSFEVENGDIKSVAYDEISGCCYFAISTGTVCMIAKYDKNGQKNWEKGVATASKSAEAILMPKGVYAICNANGKITATSIDTNGNILSNNEIADNCSEIKTAYSASANDMCIVAQDNTDKTFFVLLESETGNATFCSK